MERDISTDTTSGQAPRDLTRRPRSGGALARAARSPAARLAGAALLGALLIALAYQVPAAHAVDVGGYDAAYVQGFYDPERAGPGAPPYLDGSDGSARWTRGESYLLLPQAGLPAEVTLRARGRPGAAPSEVIVLLNNASELGRFSAGEGWGEHTVRIDGGLLKPEDVLITLRSAAAPLSADDPRAVGLLLDRVSYRTGPAPIMPYPTQVAYGGLAAALLWLFLSKSPEQRAETQGSSSDNRLLLALAGPRGLLQRIPTLRLWLGCLLALGSLFLFLYRLQPPYPAPLRGLLPGVCIALGALLALRHAPTLARRLPWLPDALAAGGIGVWTGAVLLAARGHTVLSVPGVEKDFRVFATRGTLGEIFKADGFYNLGYPLLLWLARPLAPGNPFLAGQWVAALSGALLLAATWSLGRGWLGRGPALIAVLALALSPLVVQYALYVGSDMPFAALCALALALLLGRRRAGDGSASSGRLSIVLAGLAAGAAFLVRHPGLLLLPVGWLAIAMGGERRSSSPATRARLAARPLLLYSLAFSLAILPQVVVNVRDTGQPLYSQQAKNVWLAVFGDGDWGRWGEASNDITLGEVALQDPGRFAASWWGNVRAFFGSGAEDTSEFGRAIQLRLLGFPANWLAVGGLLAWGIAPLRRRGGARDRGRLGSLSACLLVWIVLYVAAISVGFALPRFFLPLAPVYALAAAWAVAALTDAIGGRWSLAGGLLLLALMWGNFGIGADYVLRVNESPTDRPGQPAEAVEAVRLVRAALGPGDRLLVRVPGDDEVGVALGKYSAIAHLVAAPPASDAPETLRASGAGFLLWSERLGPAPPVGPMLGQAGPYALYRIAR